MFRYNFDSVHRSVTDWRTKSLKRTVETASYWKWIKSKMVNHFEKQICLGTGISFLFLSLLIMVPNGIVLFALLKNPLWLLQKTFLNLFEVYSCSRLLHWHHSMFRASLDATSMCFQRQKHSSRRRHRKNIRLHSNQQFYSFSDCNVCRSLHSSCFSPPLSS